MKMTKAAAPTLNQLTCPVRVQDCRESPAEPVALQTFPAQHLPREIGIAMYMLLRGLGTYFKVQDFHTDGAIFRLHCVFTAVLLFACSLIITASQYVGTPIQCIVKGVPSSVINNFCWITSTFTMPDAYRRQHETGERSAYPGVITDFDEDSAKKYYTYYQWVCFVLFFQAILCYAPKYLWELSEDGLMRSIVMGQNAVMCEQEEKKRKKAILIEYLVSHRYAHNMYAYRYWTCELLCLVNVVFQMWMMNVFFDGEFMSYGLRVLRFANEPQEERIDPMIYVFPRMTKCMFYMYGVSGTIQKRDSLCVLPLNIINEKTFIFFWFWFQILASLLTLLAMYRFAIVARRDVRTWLLWTGNKMVPERVARSITNKLDLGDWWLVYTMGRNMNQYVFKEVLTELDETIDADEVPAKASKPSKPDA